MTTNVIENVYCSDDGYRALAVAVVLQARKDARKGNRHSRKEARDWLLSSGCTDWLALINLTVDKDQIEEWISREKDEDENKEKKAKIRKWVRKRKKAREKARKARLKL